MPVLLFGASSYKPANKGILGLLIKAINILHEVVKFYSSGSTTLNVPFAEIISPVSFVAIALYETGPV